MIKENNEVARAMEELNGNQADLATLEVVKHQANVLVKTTDKLTDSLGSLTTAWDGLQEDVETITGQLYDTSTIALKTTFEESFATWEQSKNVAEAYQQIDNSTSEPVEIGIAGMETDEELQEAIKEAYGADELVDIADLLEETGTTETSKNAMDGADICTFVDAAPTDSSKTITEIFTNGPNFALSTSSSTVVNDYIYVRNRIVSGDGEELTDIVVAEYNSSYVSASTEHPNFYAGFGDYAVGNHIYRLSGYKDNIHETDKRF